MAISEADRSYLYSGFVETFGSRRAELLMSAIPLHDFDQVATKADLQVLGAELRGEMADLEGGMADLRGGMAELRGDLHAEISALRSELHAELGALRKTMTNWMLTQSLAIIGAIVGVAFLT